MSGFFKILVEVFYRLKLYLFGIRFYARQETVDMPEIFEAEYHLDSEHRIKMRFSKVLCTDIILVRGKLREEKYTSFIVTADLGVNVPHELEEFDGKSYFFNGRTNNFGQSEKDTVELIMDIYLDVLKTTLENKDGKVEIH